MKEQDKVEEHKRPNVTGWMDIESRMFDKRNDSIASYAIISPFEGTLNVICVAQNEAGSSHSEICLTTDVSLVISQRCILIKFDEHGNLITWIRPETLLPHEFSSVRMGLLSDDFESGS